MPQTDTHTARPCTERWLWEDRKGLSITVNAAPDLHQNKWEQDQAQAGTPAKNQQDVKLHCSVLILQVFLTGNQEWSHSALQLNQGKHSLHHMLMALCHYHVNTVIAMFPCKAIQATENFWGFILAMGEIFSSLQIFGSSSIFGVSGFISNRLIFQCYFRNREGKRKRETPAFNFRFHSHSGWAINAWPCPLLSSPSSWSER